MRSSSLPSEYAIIGDSHAEHIFYGIAPEDLSHSWLLLANTACPVASKIQILSGCDGIAINDLRYLLNTPSVKTVIFSFFGNIILDVSYSADHKASGMGPKYATITSPQFPHGSKPEIFEYGLEQSVNILENAGKSVVVVVDVPELPFFPRDCISRFSGSWNPSCHIPRAEVFERQATLRNLLNHIAQRHPKMKLYDPIHLFCDKEICSPLKNNILLYKDSNHLSLRGSKLFARDFLPWLRQEIKY